MAVINAEGLVLGRMASAVAKRLLDGEDIVILRAEKARIVGSKKAIIEEYIHKFRRGGLRKGPYYPKMPDRIVRRTVRGMLPYQKPRGKEAYKRLDVHVGMPQEYAEEELESIEEAKVKDATIGLEVGEVSKALGSNYK